MKLTYRGVSYEYTPPTVEVPEDELGGENQGLDWRFCNLKKPPVQQPTVDLMYRGVAHTTQEASEPTNSAPERARHLMLNRQRTAQNRLRSLLNRAAAEIGLAF